MQDENPKDEKPTEAFKKPVLIVGKRGAFPRKISTESIPTSANIQQKSTTSNPELDSNTVDYTEEQEQITEISAKSNVAEKEIQNRLTYVEPLWSGLPPDGSSGTKYGLEVLKNGVIIETIDLRNKSYWVFGRLTNCDICMLHPTISRYHTVLQYRSTTDDKNPIGFYIYDLNSTHGTFLNKKKLHSRTYTRIQVGHILKLGCSSRSYIVTGPESDSEAETALTITELKQQRADELRERDEEAKRAKMAAEERERKLEQRGISWGMMDDYDGDDNDEMNAQESDENATNPYAQSNNEELYLDNPKKTLRGYFEREGLDLVYDCQEQGMGQFLCRIELPIDDEKGQPMFAEVLHRGKKREAVVQCALEACRMLDRCGLLRKANHEALGKRKTRNWAENDYYDSDDDTYLDRTGAVEKKREMRMKADQTGQLEQQKPQTYESLVQKETALKQSIHDLEQKIVNLQEQSKLKLSDPSSLVEGDVLDNYMRTINQSSQIDKVTLKKLKNDLIQMRDEYNSTLKLIQIAKPTSLPILESDGAGTSTGSVPSMLSQPSTSKKTGIMPIFGKRIKVQVQRPQTVENKQNENVPDENEEQEQQELEVEPPPVPAAVVNNEDEFDEEQFLRDLEQENSMLDVNDPFSENYDWTSSFNPLRTFNSTDTYRKFEKILQENLPPYVGKHQAKLTTILKTLKHLVAEGDSMDVDWKALEAKKRKVMKLLRDLNHVENDEKLEFRVSCELRRILNELNAMSAKSCKVIHKVQKMGTELSSISEQIQADMKQIKDQDDDEEVEAAAGTSEPVSNPADKPEQDNCVKMEQRRKHKEEVRRQKGYAEDAKRENYDMWVPPSNQSGDGRTTLNDKYGY